MQLQPRQRSVGGVGVTLGWLMVLLPALAVPLLVAYVLREKFDGLRASTELLVRGHPGEAAAYFLSLSIWAIQLLALILVQNWPLVLGGVTLAGLVWAVRSN